MQTFNNINSDINFFFFFFWKEMSSEDVQDCLLGRIVIKI